MATTTNMSSLSSWGYDPVQTNTSDQQIIAQTNSLNGYVVYGDICQVSKISSAARRGRRGRSLDCFYEINWLESAFRKTSPETLFAECLQCYVLSSLPLLSTPLVQNNAQTVHQEIFLLSAFGWLIMVNSI